MLSQNLMGKIVDYIMSCGGDFAEIYEEDTIRSQIVMTGSRIGEALSGRESGVGIRILQGDECVYLYSGDSREENLWRLLKENWKPGNPLHAWRQPDVRRIFPETLRDCVANGSMNDKTALLEHCDKAGLAYSSKISQMRFKYLDMDQQVQIFNSEGLFAQDRRQKTRLFMEAVAREGSEVESAYYGPGAMQGFEFYDKIDVLKCVRDTAASAEKQLGSRPCPTGLMPVVIANGFCGLFFHEACGHSLEASMVADGGSEFSGRLGSKVASSRVTLIDDGSIKDGWGSAGFVDDEGNLTRKNVLIEKGVLKNYLVDRVNSKKLGLAANGCSRRENYRFAPASRMSNTYIAAGTDDVEQMIASVDKGIYVKNINAGSVNSMTGEFNFNTAETYLIEHGEITVPVHSATLIGVGGDILQKVERVGDDLRIGQGFCYAGSGAIYISAGQPTLKVSEMSVGGDVVC